MSHSRTNTTRKPAESSSSLAGSQTVVLVPAVLFCKSSSRLVSSCRALQVWPLRYSKTYTRGPETGEKIPLPQLRIQPMPWTLRGDSARSICEHVHHCRPLSFHVAWHDVIPPLKKKDPWEPVKSFNVQAATLLSDPTALQCELCPLCDTQCGAIHSSLSLPPAIPLAAYSAAFLQALP